MINSLSSLDITGQDKRWFQEAGGMSVKIIVDGGKNIQFRENVR
jgi:hypothetical protein